MVKSAEADQWQKWWDARLEAFEKVLGKADDRVGHGIIPFYLDPHGEGAADILYFRNHVDGLVYITSDLIGLEDQIATKLGNYELMICTRDECDWAPNLISWLARYTCEARLDPGETMDIGPALPKRSNISALLFFDYATFTVRRREAGLLLCVGITTDELEAYHTGQRRRVINELKKACVYPYTDLERRSVLG